MYSDNTLLSEVERNQKLIRIGDNLFYCDASNCDKWEVTGLIEGGFSAKDETGIVSDFVFSELQRGWDISERTKMKNQLEYKIKYV